MTEQSAHKLIDAFKSMYCQMDASNLNNGLLESIYSKQIEFTDCFHSINGIDELKQYFENLYENLIRCEFVFHDEFINQNSAMLTWTMCYAHPKLNSGNNIYVNGASKLILADKIVAHQDYFDAGAMLYEHVPLLKQCIGYLKKRMNS